MNSSQSSPGRIGYSPIVYPINPIVNSIVLN